MTTEVNLSPATLKDLKSVFQQSAEPFDEKTGMPTAAFAKQQAEIRYDPQIDKLKEGITKGQTEYEVLGGLRKEANDVDRALNPFKFKHGLERDVIASSGLQGALTASVNGGATIADKDVSVLQVAATQIFEFTGLTAGGADSHFTSNAASVVHPAPGPATDGMFMAGTFHIKQNGNTASVTIAAGESLDTIAANIVTACAAAAPAAVTVTPTVVQFETGKYKLVLESNASGTGNSFTVNPTTANMFDNIKAATPHDFTKEVRIYADSDLGSFDTGVPPTPPGTTGPVEPRILGINGIGIGISYDSAIATEENFVTIIDQINARTVDTGVAATAGGVGTDRHIVLRRSDGLAGISVDTRVVPAYPFCTTPSQVYYEGEATDSVITVDGVRYESTTSAFTNVGGFSSITATAKGSGTLSIVQGNPGLEAGVRDLVTKYNSGRDFIKTENAKVDDEGRHTSSLYNSHEMRQLKKYLDDIMNHRNDAAATVKKWVNLGITFDSDKKMLLNETQFKAAFETPALASEIFDFLARTTGVGGGGGGGVTTANDTIPAAGPNDTLNKFSSHTSNGGGDVNRQGTLSLNAGPHTKQISRIVMTYNDAGGGPGDIANYTFNYFDTIDGPPQVAGVFGIVGAGPYTMNVNLGVGAQFSYTTSAGITSGDIETIYTSYTLGGAPEPQKDGTITVNNFGNNPANVENIRDIIVRDNLAASYDATIITTSGAEYRLQDGLNGTVSTTPPSNNILFTFDANEPDLNGFQFTYAVSNALQKDESQIFKNVGFTQAGGGGAFTSIASIDLDSYISNLDKTIARKLKFITDRKSTSNDKIAKLRAQIEVAYLKAQMALVTARMMNVDRIADMLAGAASAA